MRRLLFTATLLLGGWISPAWSQTPLEDLDHQLTALVTQIRKSIVHVTVQPSAAVLRERGGEQRQGDVTIVMSGVVMRADGLIATVADPLQSGEHYVVQFADGHQRKASLASIEEEVGIAFLRVEGEQLEVPAFAPAETLAPGSVLVAIGHGKPQSATPSLGLVIGGDRRAEIGSNVHSGLLEVSAGISADDRGGVLVRPNGQVAALILGSPEQTLGFGAIPMNQVCFGIPIAQVQKLSENAHAGETAKGPARGPKKGSGWIGISGRDITDPILREQLRLDDRGGVLVENVIDNSPAEKAGLKTRDIITTWAGKKVTDSLDLLNKVTAAHEGDEVEIELLRAGETLKVKLTVGRW
jgi:S1-C subfamily serine protease